jgi:general secretion pathway protein K
MDCAMPPPQRQRGVALLVAILLVALGTIIAAAMAYSNAMTARRAAAAFAFDQALLVAQGAEAFAAYGLQQEVQQNQFQTSVYPGQAWSQPVGPTEVTPGVTLEASLEDLQGRFNINNLVETDGETPNRTAIAAFQRLLQELGMDAKWANYIVDWIDKDTVPMFPDGAEDSVYLEMNPPYRTPNLPITSTSELMALPGFTRADFDRLAPYIVALPIGTRINVCSASPRVLDALTGVVQFSADSQFQQQRADKGCFPKQQEDFLPVVQDPNLKSALAQMTEQKSSWFRLTTFVNIGSAEFSVYTLLYQDQTGMVRPVMRSFTPD